MISISATPSIVDILGRITRSRYSVICSWVMFGFSAARYISANCMPVPLTITGSSASSGSWPRTPCTLESTSVSATSGFGAELHVDADDARRRRRLRGDVVDVLGRRHRGRDRRGDEALDQVGRGARIDGGDRHHRLLDLGVLADRQVEDALEAEEEDEGGEDGREDRPADEELGEMHRPAPQSGRRVAAVPLGLTVLSTTTRAPPREAVLAGGDHDVAGLEALGDLDEAERAAPGLDEDLLDRALGLLALALGAARRRPSRRRGSSSAPSAAGR